MKYHQAASFLSLDKQTKAKYKKTKLVIKVFFSTVSLLTDNQCITVYIFEIPLMKMINNKLIVVKPAIGMAKTLLFLNS